MPCWQKPVYASVIETVPSCSYRKTEWLQTVCPTCGAPYVFHPYHLAEQMPDEVTTCVALLHDVVEDTAITLDELEREFPPEVTEPLRLLTHDPAVPYRDYIDALVVDPVARTVKRADLMHNLDETRFEGCGYIDEAKLTRRRERYRVALEVLGEGEQFGFMLERRSVAAADMESVRLTPLAGPVFEEICSMLDTPLLESTRDLLAREEIWV